MRSVGLDLENSLADTSTTICKILRIVAVARPNIYLTDHDTDIVYEGNTYISGKGFEASAVSNTLSDIGSNFDLTILLGEGSIDRTDLERGVYRNAYVELAQLDYMHPEYGELLMSQGLMGSTDIPNPLFCTISVRGTVHRTSEELLERYSASCRAGFGDHRCKIDLAPYTDTFEIVDVISTRSFTAEEVSDRGDDYFNFGHILWVTGDNAGLISEVTQTFISGRVNLFTRPPYPMQAGDTGNIIKGCTKTLNACEAYGNRPNFRGEPFVPLEIAADPLNNTVPVSAPGTQPNRPQNEIM